MASQNLSAGASSFVPGGGGDGGGVGGFTGTSQHEFEDDMYDEFMASDTDAQIEAEMRKHETADAMDGLTALMGGSTVTKSAGKAPMSILIYYNSISYHTTVTPSNGDALHYYYIVGGLHFILFYS